MRRSPLLPIFLIVVVDILGLTIMLPLLPFYAEQFGASPAVVGLLVSSYALCQLVAGPPLGSLSDQMGRKPVLIISQVGTFVGFLILAGANSLWMVFAARIIDGLTAGNLSIAQAYIADVTTPKERARSFAVIGIAFGIGFLVGPGVSGYLSAHYGFQVPILCAAGLSLASILGTTFLLPAVPPHPEGERAAGVPAAPLGPSQEEEAPVAPGGKRLRLLDWGAYVQYFRRPLLGGLLWEFFLFTFAFAIFTGGFALFAERRFVWHGVPFGPKQVGYIFTYSGLVGILVQGSMRSNWPVRVFGEVRLVTLGFVAGAVGYTLLGLSHGIALLLIAATFVSLGNGLIRPALTSL
ncbi:MAG TPA: MFS transporter, partial [Myxococcales bacterium]|nr:MFS transporter [Myxococcales bacterium]